MAASDREFYVGVDLGGTKILAGVFDAQLNLLATAKLSTKADRGVEAVVDRIARCVGDAVDECDLALKQVRGVGVGAPGAVDTASGRVIFAPNLPGWKDVPLKKELEKRLDLPVFVGNDCNVCTLGTFDREYRCKPRHLVGIFIGTGIGGGLVINGELYEGHNLTAGEIGHMVIEVNGPKCGCGNRGCLEALASRTAIFRRIQNAVKDGQKTLLTDMLGDNLKDMRSGDLRKAIRKGDKFVQQVVEEAAEYAGIGVANLINILNPQIVVVGGGVIEALENEFMPTLIKTAKDHVMPGTMNGIEIEASKLGDHAGITGAAVLARRHVS
ncbi:MAG: ROK family protein [Verrucomicrobiales bacterium]|nr:ROK family protein [Verrucomicrobiales bacterium]